MYRRLAQNTMVNLVNFGVNIVVNLLLTPIFIRTLGDNLYGIWVLVVSLSVFGGMLAFFNLGIQASLVKYVAAFDAVGNREAEREIASAAFVVYSIIGLSLAFVVMLIAFYGQSILINIFNVPETVAPITRVLLVFMAIQILLDFVTLVMRGLLEGWQRYDITRGFNIVRLVAFAVFSLILLLVFDMGVIALGIALLLSEVIRNLGHFYWIRRLRPDFRLTRRITRQVIGQMFNMSSRLIVYSLLDTIYNQMDKIIISIVLTTTFLTDYDISARLHLFIFALTTIIGPFVLPAASALYEKQDYTALKRLLLLATRYSAALTVPVAMIIIVIARPLTIFWVGAAYVDTVSSTRLFVGYLFLWVLMRVGINMLVGVNKINKILVILSISTLVNFITSLILVQTMGVHGVIWGTVIGNSVAIIPTLVVFQQEFRISWYDIMRHILLPVYPAAVVGASVTALLMYWRTPNNIFELGIYSAMGMAVFGGLFLAFGMPAGEKTTLLSYLRKAKD
ncbi:oligosaccharide flippase family protein [Anaerolineales bacterium]